MNRIPPPPQRRFRDYLEHLAEAIGHADLQEPLRAYVAALCLPGERKSVEPMAARFDPRHVRARHQSMHHLVANAGWDDAAVLRVARELVLDAMERHGAVAAWIIDDTAFPKKGRHSVGVAHQYCGALGKQENCQVAVTVTLANEAVSIPAAYTLYLPESWAGDVRRRRATGVPDVVTFRTKGQIALEQIASLRREGVPMAPVLADAGYGVVTAWRDQLTLQEIPYVVGVTGETSVWLPTMPPETPLPQLVRLAKLRWRIERDYQELKDQFGLDHYEGRGWRGFHHHGTLCVAAYAFLAAERARLSPPEPLSFLRVPRLPRGFRPRGAAPAA